MNLPPALLAVNPSLEALTVSSSCYAYIFAKYSTPNKGSDNLKRRIQPIDELLCVVVPHSDEKNIVIPLTLY